MLLCSASNPNRKELKKISAYTRTALRRIDAMVVGNLSKMKRKRNLEKIPTIFHPLFFWPHIIAVGGWLVVHVGRIEGGTMVWDAEKLCDFFFFFTISQRDTQQSESRVFPFLRASQWVFFCKDSNRFFRPSRSRLFFFLSLDSCIWRWFKRARSEKI